MMHKLLKKFLENFNDISNFYSFLVAKTKKYENVGTTNEWLIDNYYLVAEYKNVLIDDKKGLSKALKHVDNIYPIIYDIINKNQYNISYKSLMKEMNSYQRKSKNYFTYKELSLVIPVLYFIYTDKLNSICELSYQRLEIKDKVHDMIKELQNNSSVIRDFTFDKDIPRQNVFIFELNQELKLLGEAANKEFREFNNYLEENNISLRQIINDEYQEQINMNLLISNIFNNLKEIMKYQTEDIFEKASKCEKLLVEDKVYDSMTTDTKKVYRKQIYKISKKTKCSEFEIVKKLMEEKTDDNLHIGYLLFPQKNKMVRVALYIIWLLFTTCVISFFLSFYFIPLKVIGFIILFIPVLQIVVQLTNQFLNKHVPSNPLPKLNYAKGLPKESATMVVIPTIIADTKKIKEMFDTLETYYVVNKTEHLYFSLLGDVSASDKKVIDNDSVIAEYGKKYAESLNKKYKKDIFFFLYRNRVWNESEECYLGYERKRGALLQFNRYLLNKLTKEEKKDYYFTSTLDNLDEKIKYVIALDTDTKLVLNSCLNLVGCMAHPLNHPVLNQDKTKVISGYGMMQPRLNTDLEATNRSLYSQIFAGIGGFDTYSVVVPHTNQDCFGEGSFVGKGIYDLEVFDQVLYERFPDNLILSHDLLEGNYLRCGFVSDIEFIDGFPSDFLVDSKRQHRWARGDLQIISYLSSKTKNKKEQIEHNPINLLGKYKILDNIIRMFLYPMLLLIVILSLIFSKHNYLWILFIFLVIALPILSYLKSKLYVKKKKLTTVYYKNLMFGGKSLFIRSFLVFSTIPFYTKLYLDAFIRTMYRLFISHKKLLNWTTAEEVEKKSKGDLASYLKSFIFNLVLGLIILIVGILTTNYSMIIVALVFISAPFLLHYVSSNINHEVERVDDRELEEMKSIAKKTWNYFEEFLKEENHFLIPDNFQDNREMKMDNRTSATDIAFSLTSVICAKELEFISLDKSIYYLENILKSVDSLEKWNGHLYNWYSIEDKSPLYPKFVSTIDSGNLIAALMVCQSYLEDNNSKELAKLCEKMIKKANFKKLYTKQDVFSIGYESLESHLSIYNYNKFASESRLTSFVAIAKGDVSSKHWFCLDKSLTTYLHHKGLISWSGTAFEYYMPLLFMKNYSNTLLDESYQFAHLCQKSYIEGINRKLPWGISESAYNELDNSNSYKYYSFSVPYLKAREDNNNRIVISPYSSFMATELYPREVYENIIKFKKLNMLSAYGFYESYDYSNKGVVRACFAHHQGMSLMGLTNYLKKGILKDYFHQNVGVKTYDILLKEKVQVKADIDMKMARYKKYNYKREVIENDIRKFDYISNMPEVSVLSNKKYTLLMNDRGDSFSRYRMLQLNRYRKITEQDYGIFFYIKDLDTKKVWSNTYAPINQKPDKYEVVFSSDKIKYFRRDGLISTKTEITVLQNHHAEIRKITFYNDSNDFKLLQVTSYTEPILCENMDDVSHRVFQNMFLSSTYDDKTHSLIMRRKSRTSNINAYMIQRLLIDDPKDKYTYETDRFNFVGRNRTYQNPQALSKNLSCNVGDSIDPVMSLRNTVEIAPNSSKTIYFINGFGRSMEQLFDIVNSYDTKKKIDEAFQVASLMNIMNTKMINVVGSEMRTYNIMLNYLYQTTKITVGEDRKQILRQNALSQSGLWKFGISGDRPIILVNINSISDIAFVFEILKAFEYFKNKSIFVDIIIINSENEEYSKTIKKEIDDELYRMYAVNGFSNTPGNVQVISKNIISEEDKTLLKTVPRLMFNISSHTSLKDEVERLQRRNKINVPEVMTTDKNLDLPITKNLKYFNNYGGFSNDGSLYVIENNNTKTPWSNVIANESFGTIVTNNGCGYTYGYNSGEFKISSWTNEMVLNDKSEGIKINNSLFDPSRCSHGFGYSILESEGENLHKEIVEFVAVDDPVKLYIVKLKNKTNKDISIDIDFFINPVLGNFEEKTSRHILTEAMGKDNYLKMRNVYSNDYSDVNVFMSSSEKITKFVDDKILIKEIGINTIVPKNNEKIVIFSLGCHRDVSKLEEMVVKYGDVEKTTKEFKLVKEKWKNTLSKIEVKTKDESFNYMINGWYLYQTISSRLLARAGFYQVSGAFGYRDQLQDSMNICLVLPEVSRKQILKNAMHQFEEGDVLHWWHDKNRFGLRSRYKDDYLWLVYATLYYLRVTNDTTILTEEVPYVVGDKLTEYEQERGMIFNYSNYSETLLNHLLKSLSLSMSSMGRHNLPLMGGGDWNDGMNKVGIKGSGESVWLGFFLYQIIAEFISFMKEYDSNFDTIKYEEFNEKLKNALNNNAWDGKYYLRAYFDNGEKLGSHENDECKIDLISQSFSILSDVCPEDKVTSVINSVEENLVDKDLKIIKLLTPAFDKTLNDPGYIKKYPVGIRENGGQYTHSTSWYIMALLKTGNIIKAWNYYQMINPVNRSLNESDVSTYQIEPYVISADIYSNPKYKAHGGWSWYTGSAGWFYRVGVEEILGIKKYGDSLVLDPKVPNSFKNFEIKYKYNDSTYNIKVNIGKEEKLIIDGKTQRSKNKIKLSDKKKKYEVSLYIKEAAND